MARAAIPHLLERRGAIVTIASVAGLRAAPSSLAYCSSKAALAMLTQCIALDHGPAGVRANCVCPGWVRTPMADGEMDALAVDAGRLAEDAYATATDDVPLRRPSTADEIAGTVAWLLSADATYVNGAVIPVDGGRTTVDVGDARLRQDRDEPTRSTIAGVAVSTDHFIGGERVASAETFTDLSPIDEQPLGEIARGGQREADLAVAAATEALPGLGGARRRRARRRTCTGSPT